MQVRKRKHEELISCYYDDAVKEDDSLSPTKGAKKQNEGKTASQSNLFRLFDSVDADAMGLDSDSDNEAKAHHTIKIILLFPKRWTMIMITNMIMFMMMLKFNFMHFIHSGFVFLFCFYCVVMANYSLKQITILLLQLTKKTSATWDEIVYVTRGREKSPVDRMLGLS